MSVMPAPRKPVLSVRAAQIAWIVLCSLSMTFLSGCGGAITPEQKQAMAALQGLGARFNVKRGGYEVDLTQTPVEDKDLVHLKHIRNLKNVDLQGTRITSAGLEHLRGIPTLEYIYLQRTHVTKEAVEDLQKQLPNAEITTR